MATKDLKVKLSFDANTVGLQKSKTAMQSLSASVKIAEKNINNWVIASLGVVVVAKAFKNLIDEQAELAKQASLTAEQYAITTEELTKYHYVAEKAGVSTDRFNDALKDAGTKVTEFQRDGESAKEAFLALGISQKFAKEHMQTSSETMEVLLQKFAEFPDGMQKATIAQEIFGDEGSNVIRVANLGADAIKRYTEEAIRGNIATSEAFAQKSKAYLEAEHRLAALQNGWKSAVIEESQFLEVGTNMYNILGDAVMNWTVEVQAGNSSFVNGLEIIALNTEAIFPTVIEIWGIFWGSVVDVGSAVLEVGGSFLSTVGDIVGFNDSSLDSISTLGKFVGVAMGATMAIENFAGLIKLSANGLSYFGAMVQSQAIAKLNLLSASYYETMASITSLMGLIDDDFDKDSRAYLEKARDANFAAAKAMEEGNRKYEVLAKERSSILSNFHSVDQIKNQIKETMISVTVAQRKVTKEHEANSKKIAKSVKDREKEIAKNGAMSVKSLTKTMDAIKKLEDEKQNKSLSHSKATLAHQKALKSEATALKNLKKEQIRLEKEHIKEIEDALGLELQTLKIERLKKELSGETFTPVENIQNDLFLLEKQAVILKSQKDINDNTIAHLQKEIELKKAIRDENEKALKDAYELANLNLKLLIADSEINNSSLLKVDILQKELGILHSVDGQSTNQKETLQHQIDLKNKELEISQEIERARKEQSDWEQREAQIAIDREAKKYEAELRYQELLGNTDYVENAKYEKIAWEYRQAGVETTAEQIKLLEEQKKLQEYINSSLGSLFDNIIGKLKDGADLSSATTDGLNEQASSVYSDMKNSSNPTLQAVGYGVDVIEALGTDLVALETNIHEDNKSILKANETLNDVMYPHLEYTKKMSVYLENMDRAFTSLAIGLGRDGFTSGREWEDRSSGGGVALDALGLGGIVDGIGNFVYGTKTTLKKAGLEFGDQLLSSALEGVDLASYQLTNKKKKAFGVTYSNKDKMKYSDVDNEFQMAMDDIIRTGYDSVTESMEMLGLAGVDALADSVHFDTVNLDFKGKSDEEIKALLEGEIGDRLDQIAVVGADGMLDGFQQVGEELYATMARVAVGFEQANYSLSRIGLDGVEFETIKNSNDGNKYLEYLNSDTSGYITNILTEPQQLDIKFNDLTDSFASVNLSVPETVEEYENLVESLDKNTIAGAEAYAVLMNNASATAQYFNELEKINDATKDLTKDISDAWLGSLSYFNDFQKTEYANNYVQFAKNNRDSVDVVDATKKLAEASMETSKSQKEYIPIFNDYIRELRNTKADATNKDLLDELKALKEEVIELKNAQYETARFAG